MGRNRLEELQSKSKHVKPEDLQTNHQNGVPSEESIPLQDLDKDMSESTAEFFENFEEGVVRNIDQIRTNVAEVQALHREILNSVNTEAAETRLSDLVEANRRLSRKVQNTLKLEKSKVEERLTKQPSPIKKWAMKNKSDEKERKRKTELRMRQTQIDAQSRRFFEIWNEYNLMQVDFRDRSKNLLVRRCKIVNNNLNNEEIEEMLDAGKTDVFNECILVKTRMAQQQLTELQDRHDEFIKLEKSIQEVHDMFIEIGNLVSQQGETVDNILQNVLKAEMDVEKGRDHLNKAEGYAVSARKKKILCGAITAVVLIIIILVIMGELGAFSSGSSKNDSLPPEKVLVVYVTPSPTETTSSTATTTDVSNELTRQLDLPTDDDDEHKIPGTR